MGKHSTKRKKSGKLHRSQSDVADGPKFLKYAALRKIRKLRAALSIKPALLAYADASGNTALHQACRHGHADAVRLLLRRKADPSAVNSMGNTPAHLAAMHGHWLALSELIKRADPPVDVTAVNHAGLTIQQIMQRHKEGSTHGNSAAGAEASAVDTDSDSLGSSGGRSRGAPTAADADAAWRARLAEEMSDDENPWAGLAGVAWGAATGPDHEEPTTAGVAGPAGSDDDDVWADRLWRDMQEHKQQTAAAAKANKSSFTGFSRSQADREAAAQERHRRAEAAAAESARILREEQAKDENWRAAMMRQVEEAALPSRRASYESKWATLDSWPAGKPITYQDVPWPPMAASTSVAAAGAQHRTFRIAGSHQQAPLDLQLDKEQLRTLVFAGATGPDYVKSALRKELMRWHPDKFGARFGNKLAAADKDSILAGVHAVAQHLTALKQG